MFFKKKGKKMSKIELKKFKQIEQAKKDANTIKKKLATTLKWIDIDEVKDNMVILKKGGKTEYLKGIKIQPRNIFIEEFSEQARVLNKLRIAYNKIKCPLYFNFVYTPVNADEHIVNLMTQEQAEDDLQIRNLIQNDLDKIHRFQDNFKELEFFIMIKNNDLKELEKDFLDLTTEFKSAGFYPMELNRRDYYNYINFVFENSSINDFYFSRGIFSYLNQNMIYNEETDQYEFVDTTDEFEDEILGKIINIKPDSKLIKKSKLAPTCFKLQTNKYILGDKYVTNLVVTGLPKVFGLGFLCQFIQNAKVKLFMTTERLDMHISSLLKKDYREKEEEWAKTTDPTRKQQLQNELASLKNYIEETIRNNDVTHNLTIVLSIYADDEKELLSIKKDLKHHLSSADIRTFDGNLMQELLLRIACPLFIEKKMPKTIRDNIGIPLPSDGLAGLYPFVFETLKDPFGFFLGYESQSGGLVLNDPFYYINNKKDAAKSQRVNGNYVVVGASGSGKTTAMNLIIRYFIKNKIRIIWADPEDKNLTMTKKYRGTFVQWGKRENIINIFDLKPISVDDEDLSIEELEHAKWDTELAIKSVISDLNQVLAFLFPKIDEDIFNVVGSVVRKAYEKVGISPDENGRYKSFKNYTVKDMPTMSTFNDCISEMIAESTFEDNKVLLNALKIKMTRILDEWGVYFDGHTSLKEGSNKLITSFGLKVLFECPKNLREALYHILFKYTWSLCLKSNEPCAFILDEAHTMILESTTSSLLSQFYRRARKYNTSMLIGTQEPRDFADPRVLTDGKAIFNNSVYKLCMFLKKDAVADLMKLEDLTETETELIKGFDQGEALFICGNRRITTKVVATDAELNDMGVR